MTRQTAAEMQSVHSRVVLLTDTGGSSAPVLELRSYVPLNTKYRVTRWVVNDFKWQINYVRANKY